MELEEREQWTKDLNARVSRSRRPRPLRNVLERVVAVLAGQEVEYVDNNLLDDDRRGGISGRITVFTPDVLAIVDVAGAAANISMVHRWIRGRSTSRSCRARHSWRWRFRRATAPTRTQVRRGARSQRATAGRTAA